MSGQAVRGAAKPPVQSLARAFAVLEAFTASTPTMTLSEAAAAAGLDRAAARRYLLTLEALGYLGSSGRQFYLRPRVLQLGYAYLSSLSLPQLAQPALDHLSAVTGESCSVTVLDGVDVAYIAVTNSSRNFSVRLSVGNRIPAYCTALGRVLLSDLDDADLKAVLSELPPAGHTTNTVTDVSRLVQLIRTAGRQGWCVVDQELENGVRSASVPIRRGDAVVAAMSVTAPSARVPLAKLKGDMLTELRAAAQSVQEHLDTAPA